MKLLSTLFVLLLVVIGITFAILNASAVHLNYYFGGRDISLSLLLAFTLAVGSVFGIFCVIPVIFRLKRGNKKLKGRIKQVEKEVDNLRAIPIRDSH